MRRPKLVYLNRHQLAGTLKLSDIKVINAVATGKLVADAEDLRGSPLFDLRRIDAIKTIFSNTPEVYA